jgi:hypothetical protein
VLSCIILACSPLLSESDDSDYESSRDSKDSEKSDHDDDAAAALSSLAAGRKALISPGARTRPRTTPPQERPTPPGRRGKITPHRIMRSDSSDDDDDDDNDNGDGDGDDASQDSSVASLSLARFIRRNSGSDSDFTFS